jgi:hypothetical protein
MREDARDKAVKALAAIVALSMLGTAALAKPAPIGRQQFTQAADAVVFIGPAGAMAESDYFRAPPPASAARKLFPCRLQMFAKTRLAQTCH